MLIVFRWFFTFCSPLMVKHWLSGMIITSFFFWMFEAKIIYCPNDDSVVAIKLKKASWMTWVNVLHAALNQSVNTLFCGGYFIYHGKVSMRQDSTNLNNSNPWIKQWLRCNVNFVTCLKVIIPNNKFSEITNTYYAQQSN